MRLREKWVLSAERAAEGGLLSYQNWFDKAASLEAVRSQACVDFFSKVMTRVVPQLRKQLWSDAPSSQMMFDLVRDDAL